MTTASAVDRFKKSLEAIDDRVFLDWVEGQAPLDPALQGEITAFVQSERSRLIKLKSLGLTHKTDERLALIDRLLRTLEGA
ncbi:MAG: hypothetical protein SGI90_15785 [Candidatus Eisenbacteria bacterium]|nr:hypothetical protein [Candidatus Eisenbacteria bacterium]